MKSVLALLHVPHETLGIVAPALAGAGLACRAVKLFREVPESLPWDEAAGLIVMGGPMNVDQTRQHPFLAAEPDWIREAIDRRLPVLGVCLGSQLVAKALGAPVTANPVKEIGWHPLELSDAAADDRLLAGCPRQFTVFQWHGDTFALPEGAVPLARSTACENQAFRHGDGVYAFQFHLEVTAGMMDSWLDVPENRRELATLKDVDAAGIRRLIPQHLPPMLRIGAEVFRRFAAMCRESV
jgi:GMP synthase (glutamine-hydrolysing)